MKQVSGTVISADKLLRSPEATYYLLRVSAPDIAASAKPGQFLMVKCGPDVTLRRPMSIHSVKRQSGEIEMLFTRPASTGLLSSQIPEGMARKSGISWLAKRKKEDILDLVGPLGNGFRIDDNSHHVLLVAGGIGIAPMQFLAEECIKRGKKVTLLFGARNVKGIYPARLLPRQAVYVVTTEDGSYGHKGKITGLIPQYIESADQVFACGPNSMYREISKQVKHRDIQASLEVRMGCGFGICYGCSINTKHGMKRVCRDGPVFNINDIIWQEVKL